MASTQESGSTNAAATNMRPHHDKRLCSTSAVLQKRPGCTVPDLRKTYRYKSVCSLGTDHPQDLLPDGEVRIENFPYSNDCQAFLVLGTGQAELKCVYHPKTSTFIHFEINQDNSLNNARIVKLKLIIGYWYDRSLR